MDDFLKKYFRRLHTSAMDYDVLARLVDDKKKGVLTAEQKSWFDDGFIEEDTDKENKLGYRAADEPSLSKPEELHEDELIKLYKRIARDMYSLKSASAVWGAKDKDTKEFINKYVDDLQLFPIPTATDDCEVAIQVLLNLLDTKGKSPEEQETIKKIKQRIVQTAKTYDNEGKEKLVFTGATPVESLDKFINEKLKSTPPKYNSDRSVQDKLKAIASGLYNDWRYSAKEDEVTLAISPIASELSTITQEGAFDIKDADIDKDKLESFGANYGADILNKIYFDNDVRGKFADKDPSLVDIVTKAEGKISYHDPNSDNYVPPKTDDVLTPAQQIEKWATDTYKNTLRKYARLRGDPLLFSTYSKEICKALDKEDIKPTDGLDGLLKKSDAVKKRITNKKVLKHFDWFVNTMNEVQSKYPKAVAGAWNNAAQMQCVIGEIMLKATRPGADDGDMEKAKTAMEIMTAMKYGMMTSKVMDALKQTDFNIFSDGKLSWNKNEGIQFVTKAFDKSIKAAFLGVGYGITFVRNKIMMSGMQFTKGNNKSPALAKRIKEEEKRLQGKKLNDEKVLTTEIDNIGKKRQEHQDVIDAINSLGGFEVAKDLKSDYETRLQPFTDAKKKASDEMKTYQEAIADADKIRQDNLKAKEEYEEYEKIANEQDITDKQKEIADERKKIEKEINETTAKLNASTFIVNGAPITNEDSIRAMREQLAVKLIQLQDADKEQQLLEVQLEAQKKDPEHKAQVAEAEKEKLKRQSAYKAYKLADTAYNNAKAAYEKASNDYENADKAYQKEAKSLGYEDLSDKVSKFEDATQKVTELTTQIEEKEKALREWPQNNHNKLLELENFWNFLQTGKTKTWSLFTDRAQKRFDNKRKDGLTQKEFLLQQYIQQHGLTP